MEGNRLLLLTLPAQSIAGSVGWMLVRFIKAFVRILTSTKTDLRWHIVREYEKTVS